jgi:hypothetical protein
VHTRARSPLLSVRVSASVSVCIKGDCTGMVLPVCVCIHPGPTPHVMTALFLAMCPPPDDRRAFNCLVLYLNAFTCLCFDHLFLPTHSPPVPLLPHTATRLRLNTKIDICKHKLCLYRIANKSVCRRRRVTTVWPVYANSKMTFVNWNRSSLKHTIASVCIRRASTR